MRNVRQALGLTQAKFGRRFGVRWLTVSRWERGETTPAPEYMERLQKLCMDLELKRLSRLFAENTAGRRGRRKPLMPATLRAAVELWVAVLIHGGAVTATAADWRRILRRLSPHFFDTLPEAGKADDLPLYAGAVVGLAMEAALAGESYASTVAFYEQPKLAWIIGEVRLVHEFNLRWDTITRATAGIEKLKLLKEQYAAEDAAKP